jgi:hypothetical protein
MVNYFRAFQWKDPFRFKCVHEDDLINRFQVNNKTNSVTAYCMRLYALRYQEGICLFRIRSRSLKQPATAKATATRKDGQRRDKEIMCKIRRFLTQMKFIIDHIHAVCSLPLPTILGRRPCSPTFSTWFSLVRQDVKDSICMIVTFADMAHEPRRI